MGKKTGDRAVVLIVDDDEGIREALRMALSYEGYEIRLARHGGEGLEAVSAGDIDLIIADVMMPLIDGLSMCRTLRRNGDRTPILVLTARTTVPDRVGGLDAGADDYLLKPFELDELLARVRALLRRMEPDARARNLQVDNLTLDVQSFSARRGDREIETTKTEFELLHLLMSNPGTVLTREVIYDRVWGVDVSATSRSLDVYISYLRQKTEAGGEARIIHTVRGTGFTIRPLQ